MSATAHSRRNAVGCSLIATEHVRRRRSAYVRRAAGNTPSLPPGCNAEQQKLQLHQRVAFDETRLLDAIPADPDAHQYILIDKATTRARRSLECPGRDD